LIYEVTCKKEEEKEKQFKNPKIQGQEA